MSARLLALVASYLLGAIPTSLIVGRLFRGIDLRKHGSGNLGATNVYRTLGPKFAIPVGLFDMAKGAVPVMVIAPLVSASAYFAIVCGIMAVIGHVFSVFVGFKGGKGVATASGVMLGLTPWAVLVSFLVWALIVRLTGYVSLGSIVSALILPVAAWLLHPSARPLIWIQVLVAVAIVWLHRANIRRLLAGTENRFGRRGRQEPAA
ncbi:MAG TPA: glycerol-3-phosphate 1-O-acyltransferase PlsY [Gemmatimonadales bacterium]|jgi:glycerol-3-phosphate acyltransferase PlsY|nr:glycerol-3-phosphate 1-O-acyltransferase PlsY [Gemmatimonadales bacterium]